MSAVVFLAWNRVPREEDLRALRAGDAVELTGRVITIRDASAARLAATIAACDAGRLPAASASGARAASIPDLAGSVIYACGPSPAQPGQVVGSAGPTTTGRLAPYFGTLLGAGVRAVIGKGELHGEAAATLVRHGALYLAAIGGLGALLAKHITAAEVIAYPELGPEALFEFRVVDFPAVVIIDAAGANFHELTRDRWRRSEEGSR
jgi:fumarate hydratase subunit beta